MSFNFYLALYFVMAMTVTHILFTSLWLEKINIYELICKSLTGIVYMHKFSLNQTEIIPIY